MAIFPKAALALAGLLLTAGLDSWRAGQIAQQTTEHYRQHAGHRLDSAAMAIDRAVQQSESVRAWFLNHTSPSPQEFGLLADTLQRTPGVALVLVAEPVADSGRAAFEAYWRQRYPDFALRLHNALGQPVLAPVRRDYLPVVYRSSQPVTGYGIGFDLAAEPALASALAMLASSKLGLSAPFHTADGQSASLLLGWLGNTRPARMLGMAILPDAIARTLPADDALQDVWFDVTDSGRAYPLYPAKLDNAGLPVQVMASRELRIGGRLWRLETRLDDAALQDAVDRGRLPIWLLGILSTLALLWLPRWRLSSADGAGAAGDDQQAELSRQLAESRELAAHARQDGLRMQAILDTTNEAIILIDATGRIERFNRAAERLFGHPADALQRMPIRLLLPELQLARHDETRQLAGTNRLELVAHKQDGVAFPVDVSLNAFTYDAQRYFVAVIRDISDRKRAERMLFESEYKHRAILDAAHIGIYVLQDDRLRYASPTLASYFDLSAAELTERYGLHDLVADQWHEALNVALDVERSGGAPTEVLMQRPDGQTFHALVTARAILFNNRPGLAGSVLDISGRKAAEQAMLRAEIRNVAILEAIPDLMLQLDADGIVVDCRGRSGSGDFGLPRDVVGQHYRRLPIEFSAQLVEALALGWPARLRSFEYSLRLEDGPRQFEARVTPASEGEWLVMLRDITERKRIEAELIRHRDHLAELVRERTAELNTLFAASPLPTALFARSRFVELNPAFEHLFGYSRASLIGQSINRLLDEGEAAQALAGRLHAPLAAGQVVQAELHYRAADGRRILCEVFGKAVDPADPLAATIWVYQDIGERRAIEQDQQRARELAEAANRAKTEFLANMSHELRTPMHAVLSFAELGERHVADADADKLRHYFGRIRQSGLRLLYILNDLLDLSRLEAGKMSYRMASLALAPIVAEVVEELQPLAREHRVRIESTMPPALPAIHGDALRLLQVVRNLLANAIKFSPLDGTISLTAWCEQDTVCLAVADEGLGIPDAELASIFDKFTQSSKTNTGAGGAGLGLAISREIITAHGGSIRAENRPGGGARFVVQLPLEAGETDRQG